jgi:Spy/CpxP family protein refolding chaperone
MKAFRIVSIVALIIAIGIGSVVAIAENSQKEPEAAPDQEWFGHFMADTEMDEVIMGYLKEQLNLTEEQEAQIRPILKEHLEQRLARIKEQREQFRQNLQAIASERQTMLQEVEQQLAEILTEDQMQELRKLRDEHQGPWQHMSARIAEQGLPEHGRFRDTLQELNLTVEQKKDLFAIVMKYRDVHKDTRQNVQDIRNQFANMALDLLNEEFDEEKVRQTYRESVAKMEDTVVTAAKMFAEMKTVLNPEQLELLQEKGTEFLEQMQSEGLHRPGMFAFKGRPGKHPFFGFRFRQQKN